MMEFLGMVLQGIMGLGLLMLLVHWIKSIEGKPGRRNDDDNYGSTGYNTW